MRSLLVAQFMPTSWLIARILMFRDKKYRILTFLDKTELYLILRLYLSRSGSFWISLALSGSLSGSLWLSLALSGSLWPSLALSGTLWFALRLSLAPSGYLSLSLAVYCSPNMLIKSLLGSQGPCSARSSATALFDFLQVWTEHRLVPCSRRILCCTFLMVISVI